MRHLNRAISLITENMEPTSVPLMFPTQVPLLDVGAHQFFAEIDNKLPEELRQFLIRRDGAVIICQSLPTGIIPGQIASERVQDVWRLCGLYYFNLGRFHEALAVFTAFYDQMLKYQEKSRGSRPRRERRWSESVSVTKGSAR